MPDHRLVALLGVIALHALALWAGLAAAPAQMNPVVPQKIVTVALLPDAVAPQPEPPVLRPVAPARPSVSPKPEAPVKPSVSPHSPPVPVPVPAPAPAPAVAQPSADTTAAEPSTRVSESAAPASPTTPAVAAAPTAAPETEDAPDTPPEFSAAYLNNPAPPYPARAKHLRQEGTVRLKVFINADGSPGEVQLMASSGVSSLDEAAKSAVRRWRFVPAKRGNRPVSGWVLVPVAFKLD